MSTDNYKLKYDAKDYIVELWITELTLGRFDQDHRAIIHVDLNEYELTKLRVVLDTEEYFDYLHLYLSNVPSLNYVEYVTGCDTELCCYANKERVTVTRTSPARVLARMDLGLWDEDFIDYDFATFGSERYVLFFVNSDGVIYTEEMFRKAFKDVAVPDDSVYHPEVIHISYRRMPLEEKPKDVDKPNDFDNALSILEEYKAKYGVSEKTWSEELKRLNGLCDSTDMVEIANYVKTNFL